jgi:hypothetical protein
MDKMFQEKMMHIHTHGFSICAGYLSAIFAQLNSSEPISEKDFNEAFLAGRKSALYPFLDAKELAELDKQE